MMARVSPKETSTKEKDSIIEINQETHLLNLLLVTLLSERQGNHPKSRLTTPTTQPFRSYVERRR
jgi:hypothetical protein